LGLTYYTPINPRIVGIEFTLPPLGPSGLFPDDRAFAQTIGPRPGYFAVSVTLLRGWRFNIADGRGGFRYVPLRAFEYFRHFRPIAKAGYAIFIYHITPDEANAVRQQLGLPLLPRRASVGE
jgi:hypothetical protein